MFALILKTFLHGLIFALEMAALWYVLQVIGNWKILSKAGKPGWHSLVPVLNIYEEYEVCWKGKYGIFYSVMGFIVGMISALSDPDVTTVWTHISSVLSVFMFFLNIIESNKLSKCYGKGIFFTLGLLVFPRFFRMILGVGSSNYYGKDL